MPPVRPLVALLATLGLFAAAVAWQQPDTAPPPRAVLLPEPLPLTASPPKYLKGNLHTHSLWSDGDDFPEMIADWYKQHGYQFLALTDHNVIAEGERWVPADANATRATALWKYESRFGPRWVERRTKKVNPGRGWVMVKTPHPTAEAIVRGIDAGDFYASTGVTLDGVTREGNELRLAIHAEPGLTYKTQFVATMRDAKLESTPQLDKVGNELPVTRVYSPDIGKVVAEVPGLTPSYKLSGKELYVWAKVISSKPHPNPYAKGDVEVAWTQPVVP